MRRPTRPLLLLSAVSLVAIACSTTDANDWCYAEDDTGVVRDSVRPDPGSICVASVRVRPEPTPADSVRPDPSTTSIQLRSARRTDLR